LEERRSERQIGIELTEKAKLWLAKEGYDPVYGARPLRRVIERYVENPLSSKILRGELKQGDVVKVDLNKDGKELTFKTKAAARARRLTPRPLEYAIISKEGEKFPSFFLQIFLPGCGHRSWKSCLILLC
jgi:hypothetical protein